MACSYNSPVGCQFDSNLPIATLGGHHYCRFHLPMHAHGASGKAAWSSDQILAFNSSILEMIEARKVSDPSTMEQGSVGPHQWCDLSGVVFPADIMFEIPELPNLRFDSCEFNGTVTFRRCDFRMVSFDNAVFLKDLDLQNVGKGYSMSLTPREVCGKLRIRGKLEIEREEKIFLRSMNRAFFSMSGNYQSPVSFEDVDIGGKSFRITGCNFFGGLVMNDVTVTDDDDLDFRSNYFGKEGVPGGSTINLNMNGQSILMTGSTSHHQFTLSVSGNVGKLVASKCAFVDSFTFKSLGDSVLIALDFTDTDFSESATISGVRVRDSTKLVRSTFEAELDMSKSVFMGDFDISTSRYSGGSANSQALQEVNFSETRFEKKARFTNREFLTTTDFTDAEFRRAPEFHGCRLHQDTKFTMPSFSADFGPRAASAFQVLRLQMENHRSRYQEGIFHKLERRAERVSELRRFSVDWLFSWAYELSSEYGTNLARPILILVLLWPITGIALATISSPPTTLPAPIDVSIVMSSMSDSAANILAPLGVWRGVATGAVDPGWPTLIVSTLESLLAAGLIASFLLTLRWRFRRG